MEKTLIAESLVSIKDLLNASSPQLKSELNTNSTGCK